MAIDRSKAFEVEEHGIQIDGGFNLTSGAATPTHTGKKGDRYFKTSDSTEWKLDADGSAWVEVTGGADGVKAGVVAGASFTSVNGEQVYDVVFAEAFADTDYSINVLSTAQRVWHYSNKTTTGFRINSQSNSSLSGENIDWQAIKNGES